MDGLKIFSIPIGGPIKGRERVKIIDRPKMRDKGTEAYHNQLKPLTSESHMD